MIRLIVDSTFGVTEEYAKKHNIEVVSLKVVFKDATYSEGFQDNWPMLYEKMEAEKIIPTTSQPSPQDFMDSIDKIYSDDENAEILILTIANSLSGTINAATIAANSYEGKTIVARDSSQAATCGRILTEEVVEHIENGISFNDLLELLPKIENSLKIQFVPHTMENLKRGGRIGTLSATVASILKIKPVFKFEGGKVFVTKKVLGLQRAIADMISMLPKQLKKLYVCYIHDKINLQSILDKLKSTLNITDVECVNLDPVFGAHVGIGAIGLASLATY